MLAFILHYIIVLLRTVIQQFKIGCEKKDNHKLTDEKKRDRYSATTKKSYIP